MPETPRLFGADSQNDEFLGVLSLAQNPILGVNVWPSGRTPKEEARAAQPLTLPDGEKGIGDL